MHTNTHVSNCTPLLLPQIVPVEVTIKLLLAAIEKADRLHNSKLFLVDGFPRNTNNLAGWQKTVGDTLLLGGVLVYNVEERILEERLLERGKSSGRTDDNIESIKKRFNTFKSETTPVIEYYKCLDLVHEFDGARSIDEVWTDTKSTVQAMVAKYESEN